MGADRGALTNTERGIVLPEGVPMNKVEGVKRLMILCASLALAGCEMPSPPEPDQELRQELFFQCLQLTPKGPESVQYNDWAEVVSECGHQARSMALPNTKKKVSP